mmetsp:Transcript_125624/g.268077  ORF Transcript_125624/g.268077 Transcript_125624/m.268077 type:complete len:233 (+) Transcript_125624:61-759(+)
MVRARHQRRCAPASPVVVVLVVVAASFYWRWRGGVSFAGYGGKGGQRRRNPAPYGRIGGKPIIPNPEAEKFPAGVPRDEDGFPVITLREQYETNVTMYNEGLGPFPPPVPDFSGDWDFIPPDPEDDDFDPNAPMPSAPPDAPAELMELQDAGVIVWPEVTPDEPIPEGKKAAAPARKVAAPPEPAAAAASSLPDDIDSLKVPELKKLLQERGLPTTGKKADLVQRLKDEAGR